MEQTTQLLAGKHSPTFERTRAYMGSTLTFPLRSEETGGRISDADYDLGNGRTARRLKQLLHAHE